MTEYWMVSPGEPNGLVLLPEDGTYVADAEYAQAGEIPVRTLPGISIERAEVFS